MSRIDIDALSHKALALASQVGDNLRHALPDNPATWLKTGAALGAARTGTRVAGNFVRRNPAVAVVAVAGAGLAWYLARRHQKKLQAQAIEGKAQRIEARRAPARKRTTRRATRTAD